MHSLASALASADGLPQRWNEVYRHPSGLGGDFGALQRLEAEALKLGRLPPEALQRYQELCGLELDVGVGSLVLALNGLEEVHTLSSCSSVHAGAHEEEALVAFAAPAWAYESLKEVLGEHLRPSQQGAVQVKGHAVAFSSYIDARRRAFCTRIGHVKS